MFEDTDAWAPKATPGEAHAEWHRNAGRYRCCPWDCAIPEVLGEQFEADHDALERGEGGRIRCGACGDRHAYAETVKLCYAVKADRERYDY